MHRDIDTLIARMRRDHPSIAVEQLSVAHPGADDDGLWFFKQAGSSKQVQLESSTGAAPFLVESNQEPPAEARTIDQAITLIVERLSLGQRTA